MLRLYLVAAVLLGTAGASMAGRQQTSVWDGVYSTEQAARGRRVFEARNCVSCHAEDCSPGDDGTPPIRGAYFMTRWDGQTVGEITAFIFSNMPRTKPRSLTPDEVADVAAYLLQLNGLPPGMTALPADPAAAGRIRFSETR